MIFVDLTATYDGRPAAIIREDDKPPEILFTDSPDLKMYAIRILREKLHPEMVTFDNCRSIAQ
jgi:hypothetical protein